MLPSAADAYTALQSFKPQDPNAVISSANSRAGVDANQSRVSDLRSAVSNLNSSLNAVDPSVTGRTSGTFTTEAQRSALVNREQQPIQTDLTARNNDLNIAGANLSDSQTKANSLAAAVLSADKDTYQRLLDSYNAASAAETAKQAAALDQQKLAEQRYEADLTANSKTTNSGIDLSPFLSLLGGDKTPTTQMAPQEVAYKNVQNFLRGNDASIRSDYAATLKSANRGNAVDKLKIQYYNQARPDLFAAKPAPKPSAAPSSSFRYAAPMMSLRF